MSFYTYDPYSPRVVTRKMALARRASCRCARQVWKRALEAIFMVTLLFSATEVQNFVAMMVHGYGLFRYLPFKEY